MPGAGSGKTRVLVHRIAWLIEAEGVSPYGLLAVTFTNKAAAEMRQRIEALLSVSASALWVGTFHGIAHRLLRMHWQEAGLPQNFQILDADDQQRLVKRVMRALDIDEHRWPVRQAVWAINKHKDEGRRAAALPDSDDLFQVTHKRIYESYEALCNEGGLVDFAELLLRCLECLRGDEALLAHYRHRFGHILVDEFQDTNGIQYDWLKLLAGGSGHVMAVGDDDQSIYGWRGARIENVRAFINEFQDVATIRLEQNYRSTGNILDAANALIGHNAGRLPKSLWTEGAVGEPIQLYSADNDLEEARFVAERIAGAIDDGGSADEMAVLYRSNAQSRVLEEALMRADIPYRIYGGFRFFERAEIKNALSYLRLAHDRHADVAFERVVNTPPRGIGEKTLEAVRELSRSRSISLWQASKEAIHEGQLRGRAANAVAEFIKLIDGMAEGGENLSLHELAEWVIEASGLMDYHGREPGERGLARKENLQELVTAARQFSGELVFPLQDSDQPEVSELEEFLDQAGVGCGGPGVGRRPRRADDDAAFGQGAGVPHRVHHRLGGGPVPPPPIPGNRERLGGGAQALLRGHHPRHAYALSHPCRDPPPARRRELQPPVPLHPRTAAEPGLRNPRPAHGGPLLKPAQPGARPVRPRAERRQHRPAGGASEIWRGRGAAMRRPRRTHPGAGPFRRRRRKVADAQRGEPGDLGLTPLPA